MCVWERESEKDNPEIYWLSRHDENREHFDNES